MITRILPHYRGDIFIGFVIWAFNQYLNDFEPAGMPFAQYKHAVMALRSFSES